MQGIAGDLRFVVRRFLKSPAFTITVVLTLALGIGVTTAIFSLVEGILLRPLPFRDSGRLVILGDHLGASPGIAVAAREIGTYSSASSAFSSMGGFLGTSFELSGGATPEQISAARLTAGVFPTLGVQPALGRFFTKQEEDARAQVTVISDGLWMNRFHRDPRILGSPIELNRKTYSIIGVMPRSFVFPVDDGLLNPTALWVPMSLTPDEVSEASGGFWGYRLIGRLKEGVSPQAAAQDAGRVAQQVMREFPPSLAALHIRGDAQLLREYAVGESRPLLRTLFVAVSIVLLIACINVAILLLVRAIRRRREHAVRLALGARTVVIVRESLLEGLLLSLMGGLLGLALAALTLRIALPLLPDSIPRLNAVSIDPAVAAFAILLALFTGLLCSVAPAFATAQTNLIESLKEAARSGGAKSHTGLRSVLVVAEIAIALVLLTAAGALLRSYQKMLAVDLGYRADHVLVAGYQLPLSQYATDDAVDAFHHDLLDRLSHKPGVVATAVTNILPSNGGGMSGYTLDNQPAAGWKLKFAFFGTIDGDYFRSLGIPLLQGRLFNANDRADTPPVIIVNQSFAQHSWPGQSALGKRMKAGNPKKPLPWATVVGVVGNTKTGAREDPDADQWFAPDTQPAILYGQKSSWKLAESSGGYITMRSALPPDQMRETLRAAVTEIDPLLALHDVRTMEDVVSESEAPRRLNTGLITAFAAGALLLAIIGIYAVIAFSVSLRTQEIAIRMALGAQRENIARLVLASGARLALVGCAFGVLGSFAVSKAVDSFLFGVSATDPMIYSASVLAMLLVALVASALPAVRAASADPIQALRSI